MNAATDLRYIDSDGHVLEHATSMPANFDHDESMLGFIALYGIRT